MLAFLTSCKRHDLLKRTLDSLPAGKITELIIHEDSFKGIQLKEELNRVCKNYRIEYLGGVGQIESIKIFLDQYKDKVEYYLHLEDDWEFDNTHDWLQDMIDVAKMPYIRQVRSRGEHVMDSKDMGKFDAIKPTEHYGNKWFGFSWNPSLMWMPLFKKINYNQDELSIDREINETTSFISAYLKYDFYKHIGSDKSTRV